MAKTRVTMLATEHMQQTITSWYMIENIGWHNSTLSLIFFNSFKNSNKMKVCSDTKKIFKASLRYGWHINLMVSLSDFVIVNRVLSFMFAICGAEINQALSALNQN